MLSQRVVLKLLLFPKVTITQCIACFANAKPSKPLDNTTLKYLIDKIESSNQILKTDLKELTNANMRTLDEKITSINRRYVWPSHFLILPLYVIYINIFSSVILIGSFLQFWWLWILELVAGLCQLHNIFSEASAEIVTEVNTHHSHFTTHTTYHTPFPTSHCLFCSLIFRWKSTNK
jgi:hypothetical protein